MVAGRVSLRRAVAHLQIAFVSEFSLLFPLCNHGEFRNYGEFRGFYSELRAEFPAHAEYLSSRHCCFVGCPQLRCR